MLPYKKEHVAPAMFILMISIVVLVVLAFFVLTGKITGISIVRTDKTETLVPK